MGILVNENQIGGGGPSNTSHNIGDIFYTTRTDNSLNGAVECNGSQYNFSDFDSNLQSLFDEGKLPYLPISEFDEMVTNQGGCDSFGYGTDTEWTQWETMTGYVYTNKFSVDAAVGDPVYDTPGGNIIGNITGVNSDDRTLIYYQYTDGETGFAYFYNPVNGPVDSTTYFKVPKKLSRVLVRSQKPTADNNYTWYNLYSDGWCEQGGIIGTSTTPINVKLPITMKDVNYTTNSNTYNDSSYTGVYYVSIDTQETTTIRVRPSTTNGISMCWQVSGYANSSEYTKDKWNYQNVQVERPMVQLFNGNTDTALATCTSVLTDVSTLNSQYSALMNQDSVIYWYSPLSNNNNPHPDIVVYLAWYRIYKSGWVVQGGTMQVLSGTTDISLPIEMAGGYLQYDAHVNAGVSSSNGRIVQVLDSSTSTTLKIISNSGFDIFWRVEGQSNIL